MKTFLLNASTYIDAESREDAIRIIEEQKRNDGEQSAIAYELLDNCEVLEE